MDFEKKALLDYSRIVFCVKRVRRDEKMKLSNFKVVVSVLLIAMVVVAYNIALVVKDIWRIQGALKKLYWIAENTYSGMVGWAIELTEEALEQKLMHLKILAVAMAVLVVTLILSIKLKHSARKRTNLEEGEIV